MFASIRNKARSLCIGASLALAAPLTFAQSATPAPQPTSVQELIASISFDETTQAIFALGVVLMGVIAVAASVRTVLAWFSRGANSAR